MRGFSIKKIVGLCALVCGTTSAHADNWGCEVLLCMANPNGITAVAECVPPIKRLWRELSKGRGFPSCNFQDDQGNDLGPSDKHHAQHGWAHVNYCPPPYVVWPEEGSPYCSLSGAITVTLDGAELTRVWWTPGGDTVTEFHTKNPSLAAEYQARLAAYEAQQALIAQQQAEQNDN